MPATDGQAAPCLTEMRQGAATWHLIMRLNSEKGIEKQRSIAENVSVRQAKLVSPYCAVCDNHRIREMQRQSNDFL